MAGNRKRRKTETRLDEMADRVLELERNEDAAGDCPKCHGELVASRIEIEQGTCTTLRCTACGYVYMQRS